MKHSNRGATIFILAAILLQSMTTAVGAEERQLPVTRNQATVEMEPEREVRIVTETKVSKWFWWSLLGVAVIGGGVAAGGGGGSHSSGTNITPTPPSSGRTTVTASW